MALNSILGVLFREYMTGGLGDEVVKTALACVPVACIGIPVGVLVNYRSSLTTARVMMYLAILVQFTTVAVVVIVSNSDLVVMAIVVVSSTAVVCYMMGMGGSIAHTTLHLGLS